MNDFPRNSEFAGANGSPGKEFGDAKPRSMPSGGGSVTNGLSCQYGFSGESAESLGMGNNEKNGMPIGPQKGTCPNNGASAKLRWG